MSPHKSQPKAAAGLKRDRSPFERVLLTLSLAAIAAVVVGLFIYSSDTAGDKPSLTAQVEVTGKVDGGTEILVKLTNEGGSGAEDVVVEVKIGEETREVSFVRIAKDEQRTGAVIFPPEASGRPEVAVLSYNNP